MSAAVFAVAAREIVEVGIANGTRVPCIIEKFPSYDEFEEWWRTRSSRPSTPGGSSSAAPQMRRVPPRLPDTPALANRPFVPVCADRAAICSDRESLTVSFRVARAFTTKTGSGKGPRTNRGNTQELSRDPKGHEKMSRDFTWSRRGDSNP